MLRGLWVADLHYSANTATKIAGMHRVGIDEVYDAVVCVAGLPYDWDDHPERGRRARVQVTIRRRVFLVILYRAVRARTSSTWEVLMSCSGSADQDGVREWVTW